MNKTVLNRVREVFAQSGESQTGFAKKIGVTPAYIWKILNKDDTTPSDRTIADICREFNVSEVWLRTGEGEMHIELPEDAEFDLIMTEIQESDDDLIKSILKAYWELSDTKKAAVRDWIDGIISNFGKEKAGK